MVARFYTFRTVVEIAPTFGDGHLLCFRLSQSGMIAGFPSLTAVRDITLVFCNSHILRFGQGQLPCSQRCYAGIRRRLTRSLPAESIWNGRKISHYPCVGDIALMLDEGHLA